MDWTTAILLIALAVIAGILYWLRSRRTGAADRDSAPPIHVLGASTVTAFGRMYGLQVLGATMNARRYEILQITGDGVIISFHGSASRTIPDVVGDTISFGGHQFQVLPAGNEYLIDGARHSLAAPGLYAFSDGELVAQIQ